MLCCQLSASTISDSLYNTFSMVLYKLGECVTIRMQKRVVHFFQAFLDTLWHL